VRQAEHNVALLIYGRLAPAWLSLRPWYSRPALRALVEGRPAPGTAPLVSGLPQTARRSLERSFRRAR
jgi:hypothetical protein